MTDEQGKVVYSVVYDPYGNTVYESDGHKTHFKFTDQEKDEESGLYYYGARYYDPFLGRFIQPDPVLDDISRYTYCHNNPVKYTDPTGNTTEGNIRDARAAGAPDFVIGAMYTNMAATSPGYMTGLPNLTPAQLTPPPMPDTNTYPPQRSINPIKGGINAPGYDVTNDYGAEQALDDVPDPDLHAGLDQTSNSREVVITKDGKVVFSGVNPAGKDKNCGVLVIVKNNDGTYSLYGHMDPGKLQVKNGENVKAGDAVGPYANPTVGNSTGPHLHYQEVRLSETVENKASKSPDAMAKTFMGIGYWMNQYSIPSNQVIKSGITAVKPQFIY